MRRSRKTKTIRLTEGSVNRFIDSIFHPHFHSQPCLILVDGVFHAIVEANPEKSLVKFVRYSLPVLVRTCAKTKEVTRLER